MLAVHPEVYRQRDLSTNIYTSSTENMAHLQHSLDWEKLLIDLTALKCLCSATEHVLSRVAPAQLPDVSAHQQEYMINVRVGYAQG